MAICPGKNWRAKVSLTTATLGVPERSETARSRPTSSGIPMVEKYPVAIQLARTSAASPGACKPGTETFLPSQLPPSGVTTE